MKALAVIVVVGCYAPHPHAGSPCDDGPCPEGLVCSPRTRTCELHASDAGVADTRGRDAVASDAATAVALVQQRTNASAGAAMLAVALPVAPARDHVLVLAGGASRSRLDSVSGGGVARWTRAAHSNMNTNVELWFGVSDGSSAVVTISLLANNGPIWMNVSEWSGLATVDLLDAATADGSGIGAPTAGPIATSHAHDLVVFAVADNPGSTFGTPAPGMWTALDSIKTIVSQGEWFQVLDVTTTALAPRVDDTGAGWDAAVIALRAAN